MVRCNNNFYVPLIAILPKSGNTINQFIVRPKKRIANVDHDTPNRHYLNYLMCDSFS